MSFILEPGCLQLHDIKQLMNLEATISLSPKAMEKIQASRDVVDKIVCNDSIIYGINTGFGSLAKQKITSDKLQELQRNLVLSHACGVGELLDDSLVSLVLLLKINGLAQGFSGVRLELIQHLMTLFNRNIYPCIPAKGSVGASGDLIPLAHMALTLLGEGSVRSQGCTIPATEGLSKAFLSPLILAPKEGLALINGLQVSAALAVHAYFLCEQLFETAIIAGALSVEAAGGSLTPFDARVQFVRGHEAQMEVAALYRSLLEGSEIRQKIGIKRVQDPYSLRCQPQIMGAVFHQMNFVKNTLAVEVNAVSDNPLVFADEEAILSGGNFHGEMIAMAADNLALAIAEIGSSAERRIALLIDDHFSGLPAYLVKNSGLHSGFMVPHVAAAAAASDNKALAHPHSVDSIPTSANQEDHVSMATNAAWRLRTMLDNCATILATEILAASQGLEFHLPSQPSPMLAKVHRKVRSMVAPYEHDRYFAPDIALIKQKIFEGAFTFEQLQLSMSTSYSERIS